MDEHLSAWSRELYEFSRNHWGMVGGIFITIWWSVMWSVRKFLNSDYMPRPEIVHLVDKSTKELESKIDDHEKREFARHDIYIEQNEKQHAALFRNIETNHQETTAQIRDLIRVLIEKNHE